MLYFIVKAGLSGIIVAAIATIARRSPAAGAFVASLPLLSILGMLWLWHDTHDRDLMAAHIGAMFWYVLPSLPMFLLIPALLRAGSGFYVSLMLGCALTVALYGAMTALGPRL